MSDYRTCMTKNMGGGRLKSLSKEDRRIEFCTIAKQCSKGLPYEEAREICLLPKEPKAPKLRRKDGKSCEKEVTELAHCVVDRIDMNLASNINSIERALINAMMECRCKEQKRK